MDFCAEKEHAMRTAIVVTTLSGALLLGASHRAQACTLDEYEITKTLVQGSETATTCESVLPKAQLLNAFRVIARYWDLRTTNSQRYELLSKRYREALANSGRVTRADRYVIPGAEPERVLNGYRINDVDIVSDKSVEVSLQIKWEQEGSHGTMTYIMVLVFDANQWLIANVHS
jgi:hypothetical protein